jgi:hypothetical protein
MKSTLPVKITNIFVAAFVPIDLYVVLTGTQKLRITSDSVVFETEWQLLRQKRFASASKKSW